MVFQHLHLLRLAKSDLKDLCLNVIQMLIFKKSLESVSGAFTINPKLCDFLRMQNWGDVVLGFAKAFPVCTCYNLLVSCFFMLMSTADFSNFCNHSV